MKKYFCFIGVYFFIQPFFLRVLCQDLADSLREEEAFQILNFLASDSLKGRGNFTPELVTAGKFIAAKFKEYGLQPLPSSFGFPQPFSAGIKRNVYRDDIKWNGKSINQSQFIYLSSEMLPVTKGLGDFNIIKYSGTSTDSILLAHWLDTTNSLIWRNYSTPNNQGLLKDFPYPGFPPLKNILFVSDSSAPTSVVVTVNKDYKKNVLFNIIGVLPGSSKPDELIIFSAHYDHIGSSGSSKNWIYSGANDDASGTTALLMLAKYFALRGHNERTILFSAFAGEELGLLGSSFLASMLKSENIKAVINIEMIGKTNVTGENSFFVTGAKYSSFEQILKDNLKNYSVQVYPDPEMGNLFQRSDNFSFALKGIPAHTIMCSDDNDPCYHQPCDKAKDINIQNMVRVIRAIAVSTQTIISGKDTPRRVKGIAFK